MDCLRSAGLVGRGQKFLGQRRIGSFFLPEDCHHPPAGAVEEQLKTIDAARERLRVFAVVAGFVGAEDLHDVAVAVGVRDASLEEAVLFKIRAATRM